MVICTYKLLLNLLVDICKLIRLDLVFIGSLWLKTTLSIGRKLQQQKYSRNRNKSIYSSVLHTLIMLPRVFKSIQRQNRKTRTKICM